MNEMEERNRILKIEERLSNVETSTGIFLNLATNIKESLQEFKTNQREEKRELSIAITELGKTMTQMQMSMTGMQGEIRENTEAMGAIQKRMETEENERRNKIEEVEKQITSVRVDVKNIDDKSKIDLMVVAKDWAMKILAGGGVLYLAQEVSKFMQNAGK
jgi:chromosome segregation ATPase